MTITRSLEAQKEAKLVAVAESKGMTANELLSQALDKVIADAPAVTTHNEPTISLRGLLAKYGLARSTSLLENLPSRQQCPSGRPALVATNFVPNCTRLSCI